MAEIPDQETIKNGNFNLSPNFYLRMHKNIPGGVVDARFPLLGTTQFPRLKTT